MCCPETLKVIALELMKGQRLEIELLPAPDDSALDSPEFQADLDKFEQVFRSHGIVPQRQLRDLKAAAGGLEQAVWLGKFLLIVAALTPIIKTAISTAIKGYFDAKIGRRVTVETDKDGKVAKLIVQNPEDIEKLLARFMAGSQKIVPHSLTKKKRAKKR